MKALLLIFCAIALFACRQSDSDEREPATLEFRGEAIPGELATMDYVDGGNTIRLSEPRHFEVKVSETVDSMGHRAVLFSVAEHQREEFGDYTESLVHRRLAILVGGEVLSLPRVVSRMWGEGLIEKGPDGFSVEAFTRIVATIERTAAPMPKQ